ncbi:alpha/beta hydrolase [Williamwhitmania taraxaci]|uniref:Putative esterase n=1 Tax=Williamwhitmania taraxaci TaxID=1640674 RepID=A0A1G6HBP7_9BACT|nr:alpha/beta hydrolase-fold protein [Williamwhitmania taraxaci]SDB90856.1 Putative esterase [Williamwhitmania taraxaci]
MRYTLLSLFLIACLSVQGCKKQNINQPIVPPILKSVSWSEVGASGAALTVVEKDIPSFQSTNLGNSRTLRILLPEYYYSDSVFIKVTVELETETTNPTRFYYALNGQPFILLPENRVIRVRNGQNTLRVYAVNSIQEKSEVIVLSDIVVNLSYKVLYVNDGQDISALNFKNTLANLYASRSIEKIIVVGIDASANRLNEYGTIDLDGNSVVCFSSAGQIGNRAKEYTAFLTEEVMPFINQNFRVATGAENTAIIGSSLGGLSAFNIAWMKPSLFGRVGAFSGSFWWRGKTGDNPTGQQINEARIMQYLVRSSTKRDGMKFWFEVGTNDETSDRDGDGIIDAIDDTRDLMLELTHLGYTEMDDCAYVLVAGGEHNQTTWSQVLDDFLIWCYGK